MVKQKKPFGEVSAEGLEIGDIVEWAKWCSLTECWESHYGVLVSMKNELRSNRLVSISTVMPFESSGGELEFFTLSLKLVSRSKEEIS
jgi:hypothetical protein